MAIQLDIKAEWISHSQVQLGFATTNSSTTKLDRDFSNPSNWTARVYDGAWTTTDAPSISWVHQSETAQQLIVLQFDNLTTAAVQLTCGCADIDSDYDVSYFRAYEVGPYHLRIEGMPYDLGGGVGIIPYYFIDHQNLPSGVSQQLTPGEGITEDSSMSLSLVDLDGLLTAYFNPGSSSPKSELSQDVDSSQLVLTVTDGSEFGSPTPVYINRECIWCAAIGNTLYAAERGAYSTRAAEHSEGDTVYGYMPYLKGRLVWLEDADDNVLWAGAIESFNPGAVLSSYDLELSDIKSLLDMPIGAAQGTAMLSSRFIISDKDNKFYIRHGNPFNQNSLDAMVSIAPGEYDISPFAQDDNSSSLTHAVRDAINTALNGYDDAWLAHSDSVAIDGDGKLSIRFVFRGVLWLVPHNTADGLSRLGFEDVVDYASPEDIARWMLVIRGGNINSIRTADNSLECTIGVNTTRIPIEHSFLTQEGIQSIQDSGVVQIADELIYYDSLTEPEDATASLDGLIASDAEAAIIVGLSGVIENGDLIQIDDEIIYVGVSIIADSTHHLLDLERGVNGTEADSHADEATVTKLPRPYLNDCIRGLYGTQPDAHEGGAQAKAVLVSDLINNTSIQAQHPFGYINQLLGTHAFGAMLNDLIVDASGISETGRQSLMDLSDTFLGIAESDTTYRDYISRICQALGVWLFVNSDGKLDVDRFSPVLAHEGASYSITNNQLMPNDIEAQWDEGSRIARLVVEMDRDLGEDEYKTKMIFNAIDHVSEALRLEDHTRELQCPDMHGSYSRCRATGSYDAIATELSLAMFHRFGGLLPVATVVVDSSSVSGIEIGSSVSLSCDALPDSAGSRGLSDAAHHVIGINRNLQEDTTTLRLIGGTSTAYGFNLSAEVNAYSAGPPVVIAIKDDSYWPSDSQPSDFISIDDTIEVRHWDSGTGAYTTGTAVVSAVGDWSGGTADITLDAAPSGGLVPAAGDIVTAGGWDDSYPTDTVLTDLAYIADTNGCLGSASDGGHDYGVVI